MYSMYVNASNDTPFCIHISLYMVWKSSSLGIYFTLPLTTSPNLEKYKTLQKKIV